MITYTATITLLPAQTGKSLSMSIRDKAGTPITFADGDATKTSGITELGGGVYEFWTDRYPNNENPLTLWANDVANGDILNSQTLRRQGLSFRVIGDTRNQHTRKKADVENIELMTVAPYRIS